MWKTCYMVGFMYLFLEKQRWQNICLSTQPWCHSVTKCQSSVRVVNQRLHSLTSSIRFTFNLPASCDSAAWQPHPLVDLLVSLLFSRNFHLLVRDMLTLKRVSVHFIPCRANGAISEWHNPHPHPPPQSPPHPSPHPLLHHHQHHWLSSNLIDSSVSVTMFVFNTRRGELRICIRWKDEESAE